MRVCVTEPIGHNDNNNLDTALSVVRSEWLAFASETLQIGWVSFNKLHFNFHEAADFVAASILCCPLICPYMGFGWHLKWNVISPSVETVCEFTMTQLYNNLSATFQIVGLYIIM